MNKGYIKYKGITVSLGNEQLSHRVLIFNLPTTKCPFKCSKCYARKAEYLRPDVLPCRLRNYEATRNINFVYNFNELLKLYNHKFDVVRFHEAGEIYSQSYLNKLYQIVKDNPNIKFYAFTKSFELFDLKKLNRLPNINLIDSLPLGYNNFSKNIYELESTLNSAGLKVKICPKSLMKRTLKTDICGKTCSYCMIKGHSYTIFKQH